MTPSDLDGVKKFLRETPAFGGLDDPALTRVVSWMKEESVGAGSTVYREGDRGREIYVIRSGQGEAVRTTPAGHTLVLTKLGVGDVFGEMTFIDMQPRSATVRMTTDAVLYSLTSKDLYSLYREEIRSYLIVGQNIARELCRRLRRADVRAGEMLDEMEVFKTKTR